MTPQFYILLWLFYLLFVAVAFFFAWRVSRSWPFPLKAFGRIALAVIFLTPTPQVAEGVGVADLTTGQFKSGPGVDDIFRTMTTGLVGTPMPSYGRSLAEDPALLAEVRAATTQTLELNG